MDEIRLKYGCNPNQGNARVYVEDKLPIRVLNGRAGYINLLDALNAWQLVRELKEATGLPAATSFKHVSPAGAAVGLPLTDIEKLIYRISQNELSGLASAYARARGADRMSSFGDFIALSDVCDYDTAMIINSEVSDGIIAPGYESKALEILKNKRKGTYTVIQIDPSYEAPELEKKEVFGITFEQERNNLKVNFDMLKNIVTIKKELPENVKRDLIISLITLKYTQSNSVCYAKDGQVIGVGAGQQSRIHCTSLAGDKADIWHLRSHEKVLGLKFRQDIGRANIDNAIAIYVSDHPEDVIAEGIWQTVFTDKPSEFTKDEKKEFLENISGVSLGSDAFFPFSDNIERAAKSGVKFIAEPGGSIRDEEVIKKCDELGITMVFTGSRLFHH
ncbi:AICARFT/IMPCHase bienzyme [Eubacterium saphenum ATCC 49989]|nr:AICARFT/IMPCHase bienzyme [Eubacterium saphenum ATCC 49989]